MKALIHLHDWSVIEKWFSSRSRGDYNHVETVCIDNSIDFNMSHLSEELSFNLGKSIATLFKT